MKQQTVKRMLDAELKEYYKEERERLTEKLMEGDSEFPSIWERHPELLGNHTPSSQTLY